MKISNYWMSLRVLETSDDEAVQEAGQLVEQYVDALMAENKYLSHCVADLRKQRAALNEQIKINGITPCE